MIDIVRNSSITDDAESRASRVHTRPVRLLAALSMMGFIFAAPAVYRPSASGKLPFDEQYLAGFSAAKPNYVFIGNSMLRTRIDEATLDATLGKDCCFIMWAAGTESAWTHQALKNIVLAAEHRPKKVFIFFRDAYLTKPNYRATDRYWWRIERLSHEEEPELNRAMAASRTWQERLEYQMGLLYPIQKRRENASYLLEWLASQPLNPGNIPYGPPVASEFNELFELEKLRNIAVADDAELTPEQTLAMYDFDKSLNTSLLPSMLNVAKNAGVDLVFVRVQRRPRGNVPPPQREELRRYITRLQAYVEANGAYFYDFNGDPELTLDRYLDGDHIRPDWRPQSTDLFLKRLEAHLQ